MKLKKYKRFFFRKGTDDKNMIDESFSNKEYYENLDSLIKNNFVVIDIGANIGAFTIPSAKIAEKVFSFEPEKDNFKLLKKNVQLNKLKNVYLFNCAVLDKEGEKELFISLDKTARHNFYLKSNISKIVKIISLKQIFDENNINFCHFLKIDTEGSEYEILKNLPLDYFKKIETIALEFHDYIKNGELENIVRFLTNNNFKIEKIENNPYISSGILIAKKSRINKLAVIFRNYSKYINSKIQRDELSSKKLKNLKKVWKYFDMFLGYSRIILRKIMEK